MRSTAILIRKNVDFTSKDVNGQFVIVSGSLHHKPVILAYVYTPNWDDQNFLNRSYLLFQI